MARTGRPKAEKVRAECAGCGAELYRYPSVVNNNTSGRFFCSKECQHRVGSKPRKKQDVTCLACGKEFYPISGGKGMYCSKACHDRGQTRRVARACEICGTTFELRPSQAAATAGRFCSKECEGRARWQRVQERAHNGKPVLLTPTGYVKVWEPDRPPRRRWVLEHRLVVEKALGRTLRRDEHVHHINGNKTDNRLENLQVIGPGDHSVLTTAITQERIRRERAELERYRKLYGALPQEE
jgi:hypothetical protein